MTAWTIEAAIDLFAAVPLFYGFVQVRQVSNLYENRALRFMQYSWLSLAVYLVLLSLALILQNLLVYTLSIYFIAIAVFTMEYSLNLLENDRVRSFRFGLSIAISSALVVCISLTDTVDRIVLPNGDPSLALVFPAFPFYMLCVGWISFSYLHFSYLLYQNTGKRFHLEAKTNFWVMFSGLFLIMIIQITDLDNVLISSDAIILALIVGISLYLLRRNPKLLFLLPQKPQKLLVIEMDSGNCIFSYNWTDEEMDVPDPLFATALESIHIFTSQTLKRGKMRSIGLDEAEIIINHDPGNQISFVLIAEEASYMMKRSFESFIDLFLEHKSAIYTTGNAVMVHNMGSIQLLVEAVF